ncbi:MAG: OprD family porin [Gammaproteobacteria bacterium]|nr:OprD family porin [Gammaproteobacteria bacterium]
MQKMKWSVIAFAVAAASTQMAAASQQSESNGFIEDSKLDLHARTLYFNRDFRNGWANVSPANAAKGKYNGYREETGLGLKAIYESGFTQGTVGFGVDAFAMTGIRLDGGRGRNGNNQFPTRDNGKQETSYGQVGGAIKARLSNTTLKYGEQFVDLPVLSMDDARLLPESTTGFLVTSEEIDGLVLHAGHFTALNALDQTARDSANGGLLRSIDLIGGRYNITDDLSAAYYYADADLGQKGYRLKAKKQYLNLNYNYQIADDQSVTVDFNAYSTRLQDKDGAWGLNNSGSRISKNNIRSLALAYNIGAHTFTVGKQCVEGNSNAGYLYGYDGGGSVYVLNDVQYNDFSQQGEKSYQARYDLDFTQFGVPGLSLMTRYVRGSNIADANGRHQGKNWERDTDVRYVIQSGAAKDLSLHLRNATYRANDAAGNPDVNEVRFIVEYPLSIL